MKKKKYVTFQLFLVVVHIATLYLVVSEEGFALPMNIVSFTVGSYAYETCIIAGATLLIVNAVKYFYVFSGMSFIRSTLQGTQNFIRKVGSSILNSKIWKKRVRKNASIQNQALQDSFSIDSPIEPDIPASPDNSVLLESMDDPSVDMDMHINPITDDPILVEIGLSEGTMDISNLNQPKKTSLEYLPDREILLNGEISTKHEKIFSSLDRSLYESNPSIEKQHTRNKENQKSFNADCMSKDRLCLENSKPPDGSKDERSSFLYADEDIQEDSHIWMGWRHSDAKNSTIHTLSSLDGSVEVNSSSHIGETGNGSLDVNGLGIQTIYANSIM